jgi:pimeloyl-ACP methyl ester carboxylesterase
MAGNPTLVFVPGAWHSAETWGKLTAVLEKQHHYKCAAVSLPSTKSDPSATLKDDIDATREIIAAETTQGRDVVVVMHSYGGIPGQSAIKGLTRPKNAGSTDTTTPSSTSSSSSSSGKSGHVIGLVIIASGFVVPAKSFLEGMGGQPPPTWKLNYETGFAEIVADPREMFYHDLPEQEGKEWVKKLTPQSLKTLTEGGEYTYAGWTDVPAWYIATTEDKSLPIEAQRLFVQMTKDAGGDVTLREVQSSHSPMLSRPEETADIIVQAVKAFVG